MKSKLKKIVSENPFNVLSWNVNTRTNRSFFNDRDESSSEARNFKSLRHSNLKGFRRILK